MSQESILQAFSRYCRKIKAAVDGQWASEDGLPTFRAGYKAGSKASVEAYKAELLKEVGEPVARTTDRDWISTGEGTWLGRIESQLPLEELQDLYTSDQVAAAVLKATKPLDTPIDPSLSAEIERTDWTPVEALQFYADQRNFDIVGSHARIIDNGAVASNALKHLSIDRLELKGDAELSELRAKLAAAQEEVKKLNHALTIEHAISGKAETELFKANYQLATAEQRVAEAISRMCNDRLEHRVVDLIEKNEYRKFMKGE